MNAKKLLALLVTGAGLAATADTFYVDANHGDDTYDGLQPTVDAVAKKGPRKTLTGAMSLAKDNRGDIVYAAPGVYDDNNDGRYRVLVKIGCQLIATGPVAETVIMGQNDPDVAADVSPFGCGANSLSCVRLQKDSRIVGFTVCGGRGPGAGAGQSVGGIYGHDPSAFAVNCVITNCIAGGTAGMQGADAIRCRFTQNYSCGPNYEPNDMRGGKAWNCAFDVSDPRKSSYLNTSVMSVTLRNCRVANELNTCTVYNSHTPSGNVNTKYYYSYYYSLGTGSQAVEESSSHYGYEVTVDGNMRPVKGQNIGIDKGSYAYYIDGASAAELPYLNKDFAGGQRVYNGAIDIGAGEYDARADIAAAFLGGADDRFVLTSATPDVTVSGASAVLAEGGELAWTWSGAADVVLPYELSVSVTGEAVLSLYRDGAPTPFRTVSAADGQTLVTYDQAGGSQVRLSLSGAGTATVSGVKALHVFYVDANHGDDTYDGLRPTVDAGAKKGPRKTLAGVMGLVVDGRGDIVYAAPGVYDEGNDGRYRVLVKIGCRLIATGPVAETVIMGQNDSGVAADVSPFGCGANSLSCVRLQPNARLVGFTVCGGRGPGAAEGQSVGGVYGYDGTPLVVNCVITNCIAGGTAGLIGANAIRCRFTRNYSCGAGYEPNDMRGGTAWNCDFRESDSRKGAYLNRSVWSVTLRNCRVANGLNSCTVYNSHAPGENMSTKFYYSYYYSLGANSQAVEESSSHYGYEVTVDNDMRPVRGQNIGIDKGSYAYYIAGASAAELPYLDKDFAGGQRVYNGAIDIGAGELDRTADYAADLGRHVEVVSVSPSVVETDAKLVRLVDGSVLSARMTRAPLDASKLSVAAAVSGSGALTVRVRGVVVAVLTADETEAVVEVPDPLADAVELSFAGDGSADIVRMKLLTGCILILR